MIAGLIAISGTMVTSNLLADESGKINVGSVQATQLGIDRGIDLSGRAMIQKHENGNTLAYAQVVGLSALTAYGAHVHDLPCNLGGGGHYKNDPDITDTNEKNEIWLSFTTDEAGIGLGKGSAAFLARPEAQSIVVHDTDGGRIACADLNKNYVGATVHKGIVKNFSNAAKFGKAQLNRSNDSSYATLSLQGLSPDSTYPSHVHNLPCAINNGGGHYKIDPSEPATLPENEMWLTVTTDGVGDGSSSFTTNAHIARPGAQSVVVHAPDGSRMGCADLKSSEANKVFATGKPITTATGLKRAYHLNGRATMVRDAIEHTTVTINVSGLSPDSTYATHVHNLACKLDGGSHYKIDPSIADTIESNEIWPTIETDKSGIGTGDVDVDHIARPEAQSVVIHDISDGARIGCFDLD